MAHTQTQTQTQKEFRSAVEATFHSMRPRLERVLPPAEILLKAELVVEIEQLKREHNAIILGHNYMEPALYHTVADFRGDSLELARKSAETTADCIVFCGVQFMAETAKILNPEKTVLIPSLQAGCSLAASIDAAQVRELKRRYPGASVVTYVNTYAAVKAESDICCTSGNAKAVVESLQSDTIIFIPDGYLAANIARETGKKLLTTSSPDGIRSEQSALNAPTLISWHGTCEVHERFTVDDILQVRKQFPQVCVLAHPECSAAVCEAADFTGSTAAMIKYVQKSSAAQYLLLTECAMADNIIAENPQKEVLRLCSIRCPHMAQITLEMTRDALKYQRYPVELDSETRIKAKRALDRMLALS